MYYLCEIMEASLIYVNRAFKRIERVKYTVNFKIAPLTDTHTKAILPRICYKLDWLELYAVHLLGLLYPGTGSKVEKNMRKKKPLNLSIGYNKCESQRGPRVQFYF